MNPVSRSHIFFKLDDYFLALPSANILKVLPTPPPSQGGMVSMGLVQLQQHSIQILQLEKILDLEPPKPEGTDLEEINLEEINLEEINLEDAARNNSKPSENPNEPAISKQNPPFLIVMRSDLDEDLWGIAVDKPPELINIADDDLSPVPEEIRLPGALKWVSHVVTRHVTVPHAEDVPQTLLVLDLPALLAARRAVIDASSAEPSTAANFLATDYLATV